MTTKQDIEGWFDKGVEKGAKHMLIVCDTFDYDDYPVYTHTDKECVETYDNPGNMQKVMEVYDLLGDKDAQMLEHRANHLPNI